MKCALTGEGGGGGDASYLTQAFCRQADILDETWVAGLKTVEDRS